jgi:hypothetical protein
MSEYSLKNELILFFLRMYNIFTELYQEYSVLFNKIWAISKFIWNEKEPLYYFKLNNEYALPFQLYDELKKVENNEIFSMTIKENYIQWENLIKSDEPVRPKILELLAAELYINNETKYEISEGLLTIKARTKKIIPPTYAQWLQIIYNQTNLWSLVAPAKVSVITSMGEAIDIKSEEDFRKLFDCD